MLTSLEDRRTERKAFGAGLTAKRVATARPRGFRRWTSIERILRRRALSSQPKMFMNSLRRPFFFALTIVGIALAGQASAAPAGFRKVLFLGNSITKHGPKADIDWSGNWGMAASAESKDYVHLVTKALGEKFGTKPEVMVKNIADFERAYAGYDVAGKMKEAFEFGADLIILAIGENVPALKTADDKARFKASVDQLLKGLKATKQPTIVVRSCFWADQAKDEVLQQACREAGGLFVDIGRLSKNQDNFARSERPFKNPGVANHPGDRGMQAIADAMVKALPK